MYVCEDCGHTTNDPEAHYLHLKDKHPHSPALLKCYDKRQFKFGESDEVGKDGQPVEYENGVERRLSQTGSLGLLVCEVKLVSCMTVEVVFSVKENRKRLKASMISMT